MIPRKPVIGLVGGIGSGKSTVARILAGLGAVWINADDLTHEAYEAEQVKSAMRRAWGTGVFGPDGTVDRRKLAAAAFACPGDLRRLERILHPWIARRRAQRIAALAARPDVQAFVADSPLLFEANLDGECDAILFVECPWEVRVRRLREGRGWDAQELARRERRQLPLEFKRDRADYRVDNSSDAESLARQVRSIFARIVHPELP